ncbi:AbrB family transcriptional regulator [Peribacillus sp. SI8-4]|uniref:AbrB family transcriptional regulator n=1 Tax=Peribacillus sp. SI8-4 TaxID=3048009 RepID=UPI002555D778|nr:AbrB family transcriptional regulator [Peribacillus sp. SI8-4]
MCTYFIESKSFKVIFTSILAFLGGYTFHRLGVYLPWMLGPLFVVMIAKVKLGKYMYWSRPFRSMGLVILGLQLGSSFTKQSLNEMVEYLPVMLFTTIAIILFSMVTGWLVGKRMNLSPSTSMLGSFPGGLSQMVVLSEEMKNSDETVVGFMQTLRIILVISFVPWLATHVMSVGSSAVAAMADRPFFFFDYDGKMAIMMLVTLLSIIFVTKRMNFPLPFLLGPLMAAAIFNLVGPGAPQIPDFWLSMSQLLIGAHLGCTLKVDNPRLFRKMFGAVFLSNVLLIGFCYLLSIQLAPLLSLQANELFLSMAPGGVAEMAVTAMSVQVDLSVVTSFHLFRILFILFLLSPIIKWIDGRNEVKQEQRQS